jgi:membrane protease YdiL (CAAX protease family)
MPGVEEEVGEGRQPPASAGEGLKGFLFPDRLRPPGWEVFGGRWAVLLLLSAAWLAALKIPQIWPDDELLANVLHSSMAAVLLLVGLTVYGWRRLGRELTGTDWKYVAYHVFVVVVVLLVAGYLVALATRGEKTPPGRAAAAGLSKALICTRVLAAGLLRPVGEEFALRFVLFRAVRTRLKFGWAAPASAVIFGLLHLPHPGAMIAGLLAGLLLSWTYERTRCVLAPVIIHVTVNLMWV